MPRRPPVLVEEILLRLPPNQPAGLFRAALVCKRWRRLITSPGFQRRYLEFHRTPPMLGILINGELADSDGSSVCRFRPRTAFCVPPIVDRSSRVLDARHGRVLLRLVGQYEPAPDATSGVDLVVCDPIAKAWRIVTIPSPQVLCLAAAVLCSATTTTDAGAACDHLDCHRTGNFLVVFVGCLRLDRERKAFIYTYSSETDTWNGPISTHLSIGSPPWMTSKCVGNHLYFGFPMSNEILKYDLQLGQVSRIEFPTECSFNQSNVFMSTEGGGGLGIATICHHALHIWTYDAVGVGWMQTRAIEIQRLLIPDDALLGSAEPRVAGFADPPFDTVFLSVNNCLYTLDLETDKVVKVFKGKDMRSINSVVPYMSFCTPACTNEGPSAGGSRHERLEVLM